MGISRGFLWWVVGIFVVVAACPPLCPRWLDWVRAGTYLLRGMNGIFELRSDD